MIYLHPVLFVSCKEKNNGVFDDPGISNIKSFHPELTSPYLILLPDISSY